MNIQKHINLEHKHPNAHIKNITQPEHQHVVQHDTTRTSTCSTTSHNQNINMQYIQKNCKLYRLQALSSSPPPLPSTSSPPSSPSSSPSSTSSMSSPPS